MTSLSYWYQGVLVPAATLWPVFSGVKQYKKLSSALRVTLFYLIFAFGVNMAASWMASYRINNLWLLHGFTLIEFVFLIGFFWVQSPDPMMRRVLSAGLVLFPLFCCINLLIFQTRFVFNTYTRPIEAIIIVILSSLYLNSYRNDHRRAAFRYAEGWVAGGLLIYFFSSFFQFLFANYVSLYTSHELKMVIWNIHATFVLIMYLLIAKGLQVNEHSR